MDFSLIRITLLTLLISYLCVFAWKDWFKAACWLVVLMVIFQHPDMPKSIAGIPGLNHWNFLFINVVFSWLINRKKQEMAWEMPKRINLLLFFYGFFVVLSVCRYLTDKSGAIELNEWFGGNVDSTLGIVNEYLINCFKWVIPALIIFDGCRDRKQYNFAIIAIALLYFLLALQVIKAMKFGSLTMSGDGLQRKAIKIISGNVGYHRVNISMMMSGAFWAIFCLKEFVNKKCYLFIIIPACSCVLLAMAMTGGRMGYVTWSVLGVFFCIVKWRKYLLLAPVVLSLILIVAPSAIDRMEFGISPDNDIAQSDVVDFEGEGIDTHSLTSGRILIWPMVWTSIKEAPFFGHGRNSTVNTGITLELLRLTNGQELFPHPHNAYLQWVEDNGFIGAIPVFLFYMLIIKYAWSLFRDKRETVYVVTGGVCLSLVLAFLIASIGSQNFYPREGAVGMWVAIALMFRVYIERKKIINGEESQLIKPFSEKDFVVK